MDQLVAVFGIDWRLLVIQAINFGLLLAVLGYFLYRPVLNIIDERRKKIADGVRTAEAAAKTLQEAKGRSEEIVGDAAREAEQLVVVARSHASTQSAEIVKTAEARAAASLKDTEMKVAEMKRQALEESKKEIARAAILAAEKILAGRSS